jgi:hypothetical protein
VPLRPPLNVFAWAVALGVALFAMGAPVTQVAAHTPDFGLTGTTAPQLAKPRYHIPFRPARLDLGPERPVLNNIPMPIPPWLIPFDQQPVDDTVAVFIPHGHAAPVPESLPGYTATMTLTFDDCGTAAQIQAVVRALADVHEHGIFFITGQCRDHFPWLVGTLQASGHLVCNHTYSHPDLRRLSNAAIRAEISRGVMAGCPYFRPPYGAWDGPRGRIARIAAEFGLQPMLWDVDSRDWAGAPPDRIAAVAKARGGIILFHLHGASTPEAIRLIG